MEATTEYKSVTNGSKLSFFLKAPFPVERFQMITEEEEEVYPMHIYMMYILPMCMAAIVKKIEPSQFIHLRIKWSMLDRLDSVMEKKKIDNRTETINYLLDLAIKFIEKIDSTPQEQLNQEMEEVKEQLKHGGLVDYATKMSGKELKLINEIIQEEFKTRQMK